MIEEIWRESEDYPGYLFSNYGYILYPSGKESGNTVRYFNYKGTTVTIRSVLLKIFTYEENMEQRSADSSVNCGFGYKHEHKVFEDEDEYTGDFSEFE